VSDSVMTVDEQTFQAEVLQSELPVLVDFWTAWCAPCKVVLPVIEELAGELRGKVRFAKLDAETSQAIAVRYRVASFPTFVLFKGGQMVDRTLGAQPKSHFKAFLERNL
jgi:thioredoxin 1